MWADKSFDRSHFPASCVQHGPMRKNQLQTGEGDAQRPVRRDTCQIREYSSIRARIIGVNSHSR
jgi:hypothetical protein